LEVIAHHLAHEIERVGNTAALKEARDELERRVLERTAALEKANQELNVEIVERKRMEDELRKSHDELDLRVKERTAALREYTVKLEQSNRDLEEFAHVASHDLQEPLRKIQTFSDRLSTVNQDCFDERGLQYLGSMQKAAARMQGLVQDLLGYARVSSKAQPATRFSLKEVAEEVVVDLGVLLEESGGRVEIGDLPEVEADRGQMRQLLQNLIGNGLKYRSDAYPLVRVHSVQADSGPVCEFHVEDNGIGFSQEHTGKIFAPFQRLHGKSSQYQGTGVGLAICRRIVERHGGSITARSTPGNGAVFIVKLPKKQQTSKI
jgi:light-regulated signal transduction histidine kinase (bacteriophytochrome)